MTTPDNSKEFLKPCPFDECDGSGNIPEHGWNCSPTEGCMEPCPVPRACQCLNAPKHLPGVAEVEAIHRALSAPASPSKAPEPLEVEIGRKIAREALDEAVKEVYGKAPERGGEEPPYSKTSIDIVSRFYRQNLGDIDLTLMIETALREAREAGNIEGARLNPDLKALLCFEAGLADGKAETIHSCNSGVIETLEKELSEAVNEIRENAALIDDLRGELSGAKAELAEQRRRAEPLVSCLEDALADLVEVDEAFRAKGHGGIVAIQKRFPLYRKVLTAYQSSPSGERP